MGRCYARIEYDGCFVNFFNQEKNSIAYFCTFKIHWIKFSFFVCLFLFLFTFCGAWD
jgi:hypothetical protein